MHMQVICFSLKMCINYQSWTTSMINGNSKLNSWSLSYKTKLKIKSINFYSLKSCNLKNGGTCSMARGF